MLEKPPPSVFGLVVVGVVVVAMAGLLALALERPDGTGMFRELGNALASFATFALAAMLATGIVPALLHTRFASPQLDRDDDARAPSQAAWWTSLASALLTLLVLLLAFGTHSGSRIYRYETTTPWVVATAVASVFALVAFVLARPRSSSWWWLAGAGAVVFVVVLRLLKS